MVNFGAVKIIQRALDDAVTGRVSEVDRHG
jgi:hypothetical protein